MNDLLADSFAGEQNRPGGDIELGMQVPLNLEELDLDKFLKQVSELEAQYNKLDELLKKLQAAHEESKSVTSASAVKGIKQKMEKNVDEVGKIARHLKLNIEEIEKDNLADSKKPGRGKGTTMERSRAAKTNALRRKLKDKMADFQSLRENIHNEYHAVVRRRVFTVTGKHVDDEAIEELIGTGEGEHIFQKAIQEQGRGQILGTLNEIKERHDSVIEVERKLQELQQIFLDMAVLVDAQGEILDNIEVHVSSAVDHVQTGNTALQRAKSLQKSSRKWMCIAIIILLLIVAVIVVAVIKPWTKSA